MINKASKLGYSLIGVVLSPKIDEPEIHRLRCISQDAGIDAVFRVDLKPKTPKELIHNLRKLRRKFEVICIQCESKAVARQAAKDHRVDLLSFPSLDFRKRFFDKAEAELASKTLAALEVEMKPLLILEGPPRIRLLSNLRKEVTLAKKSHVPIVISSGATDEKLMRKPRELAALASLFDLDEISAIEAVSKNPATIVKRNREKLSSKFIAPGIKIVRRGKDCENC